MNEAGLREVYWRMHPRKPLGSREGIEGRADDEEGRRTGVPRAMGFPVGAGWAGVLRA